MESDLLTVFSALTRAGVAFIVVGGVAVVLHGHPRATADLDIVFDLHPENAAAAMAALKALGFRPRAPVPIEAFADAVQRAQWAKDKGMTVLSLWSSAMPLLEIDLFITEPFAFAAAQARARRVVLEGTPVDIASIDDLVALKQAAGRAKDLEDIAALERLRGGTA